MANGIRTGGAHGFSKGRTSKFRCRNDNKDEDNSQKTLNDKNSNLIWKIFVKFQTINLDMKIKPELNF